MNQDPECRIIVIDDDEDVRKGITFLLLSDNYHPETYEDVSDFIETDDVNNTGCVIPDIFLCGDSNPDLHDTI